MPPRNLPDHYYYSSKTEATSSATSRPMLGKMYAQSQGEKTPGIWANAFNARDDKLKKVIVKEWSLKKSSDCDDIRLFKDALRFLAFHGGELFLLQEHGIVPLDLNHFHKGHITAIPILPEAECYQIAHRDLKISADQTLLFDLKERRRLTNFLGYTDCLECEIDSYPLAVIESLSEQELQQLKRLKPHEQIKTIYYEYSSNYTATHVRAILKRFYENTNHPEIHLIASNQIPLHFSDIERLVKSSLITKLSACIDNETIAPMLLLEPQYRAKIGILTVKVEESEMTAENVARLKELYPTQVKFILGEFSAGLNILPVLSELDNITISAFTKEMTAQMQAPLPKLRYLTLKDSSYKIVRKQFQSCLDNAANLRTITISYLPELLSIDRHNTLEELVLREIDVRLIQLKRNSFPNLKRLILDDIQCLGDDLDGAKVAVVNIIASAPNLRYLNIIDCTSSDINILEIESIIDVILAHIPSGCIIEVDMKKKPGDKTSVLYPKMVPKKVAAAYARGILIRFCNFRFDFNNGGSWNWQMSNLQRCEQISLDSITMIGSYREAYDLYEKLRRFKDVQKIEFENSTLFFPGIDELTLAHIFQANKFTLNNLRYFSVDFKSYIITQILLQIIATMPYVETLSLTHKFDQPLTKEDVIQLYQLKYLKHLNVIEDLLGSEAKQFLREIPPPFTVEYYSINTQRAIQPLNTRNNFTQQRKSQPKYSYVDMRYGSSSSNSISLNTKLTKKTFKLTPYFVRYPPQEGVCLRQKVERYNPSTCSFEPIVKDERDLTILKAFHIGTTSLQFNPDKFNLVENRNYNFHPGREGGYQFKKNEWVCIFTEEEYDKLLSVAVITTKKVNFTVARGKEGNYYVRADQTMTANVQALLATPYYLDAKNKITSYALPPEIESLVQEISAFGIDYSNASDNTIVNSGSSFFNSSHNNKVAGSEENRRRLKQLYKGEVGNCLQRAQVLLYKIALLQQRYPHCEFQMPSGSGHAWPEWRPAAHLSFQRCDRLGGYPTGEDYQSSSFFAEQISKSATHKVNNAKVPGKEKGKAPLKEDQNDSVDKKVQYGHPKITIADMTEMLSQHSNDSVGFNQLLSIKDTKELFLSTLSF